MALMAAMMMTMRRTIRKEKNGDQLRSSRVRRLASGRIAGHAHSIRGFDQMVRSGDPVWTKIIGYDAKWQRLRVIISASKQNCRDKNKRSLRINSMKKPKQLLW